MEMTGRRDQAPIFIVGSPRSGTTLMRYCLNQHSRLYIAFETGFFRKIYGNRRLIRERDIPNSAHKLIDRLFVSADPTRDEFLYLKEELREKIAKEAKSYRDVAIVVFETFAKQKGKVRWGEKTPFHILYINQMLKVFPEAKIINMERDAKAVAASYMKSSHVPNDLLVALAHHCLCAKHARKWQERVLTVRYENFVEKPEFVLREVCTYIGEEYEPAMLKPGMRDSSYSANVIEFNTDIGIDQDKNFKWKEVLTPYQIDLIDFMKNTENNNYQSRFFYDYLKISLIQNRFMLSTYKNAMGYENIKRFFKNKWD